MCMLTMSAKHNAPINMAKAINKPLVRTLLIILNITRCGIRYKKRQPISF